MEMRSRRASGISGLSDKVAALNPLPFFHRIMRKVSIDRPVAGTVVDLDDFSKTAFSPDVFNLAVRRRVYRRTGIYRKILPVMKP